MIFVSYLYDTLDAYLSDYTEKVKKQHEAAGQVATGKTRDAFRYEIEETATGVRGVVYGAAHVGTLETGRKGGRVPKGFYHIIMRWAEAKGIPLHGKDLQRFSYFVAKRIKEQGTRLFLAGGRKDIYTEPADTFAARLRKEIAGLYKDAITSEIIDIFRS